MFVYKKRLFVHQVLPGPEQKASLLFNFGPFGLEKGHDPPMLPELKVVLSVMWRRCLAWAEGNAQSDPNAVSVKHEMKVVLNVIQSSAVQSGTGY